MLTIIALLAGCAGPRPSMTTGEPTFLADVPTAQAVQAAEDVLIRMHFEVEKADGVHGVVRTRPLRSAQVFEFWRQDTPTVADMAEANIQTLRKIVAIELTPIAGQLAINCRVRVQQLSLPEARVASVSQAYQIHSRSTASEQSLRLSARQQREMAWIDRPDDLVLARRIVEQVAGAVGKSNPEGAE
jgi:hypothetical protein